MKNFKLVLGLIILAIVGLFVYQNSTFFFAKQALRFQLPFTAELQVPELPALILVLAFLLLGLLISYIFNLLERFKSSKTIKKLNATVDSNQQMISALKNELATLKNADAASSMPPDMEGKDSGKNDAE